MVLVLHTYTYVRISKSSSRRMNQKEVKMFLKEEEEDSEPTYREEIQSFQVTQCSDSMLSVDTLRTKEVRY